MGRTGRDTSGPGVRLTEGFPAERSSGQAAHHTTVSTGPTLAEPRGLSLTIERVTSSVSLSSITFTLMESDSMTFPVITRSPQSARPEANPEEVEAFLI